jgi:hypothetical protein
MAVKDFHVFFWQMLSAVPMQKNDELISVLKMIFSHASNKRQYFDQNSPIFT